MLEVAHEGTTNVRRARKHTLVFEYEAFQMKNGKTISELQTRFTHTVNHLLGLGKTFEDDDLNIKSSIVLKELGSQRSQRSRIPRTWHQYRWKLYSKNFLHMNMS